MNFMENNNGYGTISLWKMPKSKSNQVFNTPTPHVAQGADSALPCKISTWA